MLAATTALTGALIVGDSVRISLQANALERLAGADCAIRSGGFFDESLVGRLAGAGSEVDARPLFVLTGTAEHAHTAARTNRVNVFGLDDSFNLDFDDGIVLNEALARDLNATVGDDVLIRVGKSGRVSTETILGRRDDTTASMRKTVRGIIPSHGIGGLELTPKHDVPRNVFIPLKDIQRRLDQSARVNTVLIFAKDAETDSIRRTLKDQWRLDDVGLSIRIDQSRGYVALESERFLIEPAVERAAANAGSDLNASVERILTYLANGIADDGSEIPYSTVAAINAQACDGASIPQIKPGEIVLHQWAADDLSARLGDTIRLDYYAMGQAGRLDTGRAEFTLASIMPMTPACVDPGFTPQYKGVTDTDSIADWDPPFPIDLKKVRDKDDDYWKQYRAAPKAFIALKSGQDLWADDAERFGRLTSIRIRPSDTSQTLEELATAWADRIQTQLEPAAVGLSVQPLREQALTAGKGSTDFAGLFIGFSLFLIASSAMLVALLFRLGAERRAGEIGLMLAIGFEPKRVTRLLIVDGTVVACAGALAGLAAAVAYAQLMIAGLTSWWSDAVNAPFLKAHVTPTSLAVGLLSGIAVAGIAVAWSVRGLTRQSPRSLLAGQVLDATQNAHAARRPWGLFIWIAFAAAAVVLPFMPTGSDPMSASLAFFGAGVCALVAVLGFTREGFPRLFHRAIHTKGTPAAIMLGLHNLRRHRGRSMMTISLIASAFFIVASLHVFRQDAGTADTLDRETPTGGFALLAESTVPIAYDLNTPQGRDALNLSANENAYNTMKVQAFRLKPGDDTGCANLYVPTDPKIIGATQSMIARGGFRFSSIVEDRTNPWELLNLDLPDGVIPVIGDEAAVMWQLHSGLGKDLKITDERGRPVRLRFVALLSGSALQDELVVSEENFARMFPTIDGFSLFLIEAPKSNVSALAIALEKDLADYSLDVEPVERRLERYLAVQNTYISTFQTLGGLGLVLGVVGLSAVLLRNVWERRRELALMRALGFSRKTLSIMVLAENAALLIAGLLCGTLAAAVAVIPFAVAPNRAVDWIPMFYTLAAVLAAGFTAGSFAVSRALRVPLVHALRSE